MVVCVPKEFKQIRNELNERGHIVVDNATTKRCDAILCDLKNGGLLNINVQNNSLKQEGAIIVDIGSKTIDEIEYILNNKVYSSVF